MPLRDDGLHPDAQAQFDRLRALGDGEVDDARYAMFVLADDALRGGQAPLAHAVNAAGVTAVQANGWTIDPITLTRGTRGVVAAMGVRGSGLRILALEYFASTILAVTEPLELQCRAA
jgi:hypothetical protein